MKDDLQSSINPWFGSVEEEEPNNWVFIVPYIYKEGRHYQPESYENVDTRRMSRHFTWTVSIGESMHDTCWYHISGDDGWDIWVFDPPF
jgi:hypothetical protein